MQDNVYHRGEKLLQTKVKAAQKFPFQKFLLASSLLGKSFNNPSAYPSHPLFRRDCEGAEGLSNTKPLELTEEKQGEPAARERITGLPEEDNSHLESFHTFLRIEALKNKLAMTAEDKNTMGPSIPPLLSTSLFFLIEYATP